MTTFPPPKKIKSVLQSRLVIVGLLVILQILFFVGGIVYLSRVQIYLSTFLKIISFFVVFHILSKPDNPSYKISWIIVIMAAPLMGGLFYVIFGNKSVGRKMHKQMMQYKQLQTYGLPHYSRQMKELMQKNPNQGRQAEYLYHVAQAPLWGNTSARYYPVGEKLFAELLVELKKAERFIFLEYFIIHEGYMWNTILDILREKAAIGVEVCVIYDDFGCIKTLPDGYNELLRSYGIHVIAFNHICPKLNCFQNYRDHRKICVIDGITAFTGGINLADEYINHIERFGHWKDGGVMLRGEGVQGFTDLFLQMWQLSSGEKKNPLLYHHSFASLEEDGLVQPFGGNPTDWVHVQENAYMQMVNHAREYLYITTPYLILDNEMVNALQIAALSGIDVRIITPGIPDKWYVHHMTRSFYLPLLEAGVRIYEYTPGFIHAKMFLSDDETAIIGTTNMDYRSFYLNFECGAAFYNSSVILDAKEDFLSTQTLCAEVTLEDQQNTPLFLRMFRSLLRILSPLM